MSPSSALLRRLGGAAFLYTPIFLMSPVAVQAQTSPIVSVDVSLGGTADSNPFLETNGASTISATLQVEPRVYWEDETTSASIDANLRVSQYMERYGNDIGGRIGIQARKQIDKRTSLAASAGFQSSRSTFRDDFLANLSGSLDTVKFPALVFNDLTIIGRRTRVMTLDAYVGLDHTISEDDAINVFGTTSYSRFGGATQSDYRTGTLGLRYRRRLSERTSATAGVSATAADYIGVNTGDARIVSPQIGIENKLNERLSWTANVGLSIVSVDDAQRVAQTSAYLTAALSLCDKGVKSALCGSLTRSAEPTAFGGIRPVTNVAFSYEQQLTANDRFSVTGRYGRIGQSNVAFALAQPRNSQLFGAAATYDKAINDRLSFFVSPSFTKVIEKPFRNASNYAITVGVKMRLGKLR